MLLGQQFPDPFVLCERDVAAFVKDEAVAERPCVPAVMGIAVIADKREMRGVESVPGGQAQPFQFRAPHVASSLRIDPRFRNGARKFCNLCTGQV
jgi:hypothetical protein